MGYSDHVSTPALNWGKNNEDRACAAYLTYMRGKGHDIEYAPSGLHLHCESMFLDASSERYVFDSTENCYTGGCLEIKCSYSVKNVSALDNVPAELVKLSRDFCLYHSGNGELKLKRTHPYFAQVQGGMVLMCVEWCDFVVFTPARLHVERIAADYDFWLKELYPKLVLFFERHILPNFLTGRQSAVKEGRVLNEYCSACWSRYA